MPGEVERFEVRMSGKLKNRLIEELRGYPNCSLSELIVRLTCRAVGMLEEDGLPVKRVPGPKPGGSKRKSK